MKDQKELLNQWLVVDMPCLYGEIMNFQLNNPKMKLPGVLESSYNLLSDTDHICACLSLAILEHTPK
jgi:predicted permease